MRRSRLGFVTTYDADPANASQHKPVAGLGGRSIALSLLEAGVDLEFIGPLPVRNSLLQRGLRFLRGRMGLAREFFWLSPELHRGYADFIHHKVRPLKLDAILCAQNFWPIVAVECDIPMFLWTDAPFAAQIDFYDYLTGLDSSTKNRILDLEGEAFRKCAGIVVGSTWAADVTKKAYNIAAEKVQVLESGPILSAPVSRDFALAAIDQRGRDECKILFIGGDWLRKGGPKAVAVVRKLVEAGIRAKLIVIGCRPELLPEDDFVEVLGTIDKSTAAGWEKFQEISMSCHFLILPTLADLSPHVCSEAAAFALPALCHDVGGIGEMVRDEVNGFLFQPDCSPETICQKIEGLWSDPTKYSTLARGSFGEYENRLNWSKSVARFLRKIKDARFI